MEHGQPSQPPTLLVRNACHSERDSLGVAMPKNSLNYEKVESVIHEITSQRPT
jgi:hypothetical protein